MIPITITIIYIFENDIHIIISVSLEILVFWAIFHSMFMKWVHRCNRIIETYDKLLMEGKGLPDKEDMG